MQLAQVWLRENEARGLRRKGVMGDDEGWIGEVLGDKRGRKGEETGESNEYLLLGGV